MSDQRRFVRKSGRLISSPIADLWQVSLTIQDPAIPSLPLETPAGGPATITGTLAATDSADTAAIAGDLAHVGTLAATDSADTAAFTGQIAHVGSMASTDGADAFAASGTVAAGGITITGDLVATEDADAFVSEGTITQGVRPSSPSGHGFLYENIAIDIEEDDEELVAMLSAVAPLLNHRRNTWATRTASRG